jgi:hypothetical protein
MQKAGVECSKCFYWHKLDEDSGECRVNPPMSPRDRSGDDPWRGSWLRTSNKDWCGKFEPEKNLSMAANAKIIGAKKEGSFLRLSTVRKPTLFPRVRAEKVAPAGQRKCKELKVRKLSPAPSLTRWAGHVAPGLWITSIFKKCTSERQAI